ncbi:MAG TPA: integration host factor [Firmicutes bacterium]|nr:integration host factor [Bacillota bacterium]
MSLPTLSIDEKKEALQKAQAMRKKRSELRNALKKGEVTLSDILASEDEVTSRMRVSYLLRSLPRVGKIKAQKIMEEIGIDEARRIQGLGKRQREALIARFSR